MTNGQRRGPDLRADVPTLEPDEVFLARLSELAAGSVSRPPAGASPRPGWRVGLAAASVAAVLAGVAVLVGVLTTADSPSPAPVDPASRPALPSVPASTAPTDHPGTDTGGAAPTHDGAGSSGMTGTDERGDAKRDPDPEDRPGGDRGGSDDVREEHAGPGDPDHTEGAGDEGQSRASHASEEADGRGEAVGAR